MVTRRDDLLVAKISTPVLLLLPDPVEADVDKVGAAGDGAAMAICCGLTIEEAVIAMKAAQIAPEICAIRIMQVEERVG